MAKQGGFQNQMQGWMQQLAAGGQGHPLYQQMANMASGQMSGQMNPMYQAALGGLGNQQYQGGLNQFLSQLGFGGFGGFGGGPQGGPFPQAPGLPMPGQPRMPSGGRQAQRLPEGSSTGLQTISGGGLQAPGPPQLLPRSGEGSGSGLMSKSGGGLMAPGLGPGNAPVRSGGDKGMMRAPWLQGARGMNLDGRGIRGPQGPQPRDISMGNTQAFGGFGQGLMKPPPQQQDPFSRGSQYRGMQQTDDGSPLEGAAAQAQMGVNDAAARFKQEQQAKIAQHQADRQANPQNYGPQAGQQQPQPQQSTPITQTLQTQQGGGAPQGQPIQTGPQSGPIAPGLPQGPSATQQLGPAQQGPIAGGLPQGPPQGPRGQGGQQLGGGQSFQQHSDPAVAAAQQAAAGTSSSRDTQTASSTTNNWLNQQMASLFDPARLDPANDPTMKPYLDSINQRFDEQRQNAMSDLSNQYAGGLAGTSAEALAQARTQGQISDAQSAANAQTMLQARESALGRQMQGLGMANQNAMTALGFDEAMRQQMAGLAGQSGLQQRQLGSDMDIARLQATTSRQNAQTAASAQQAAATANSANARYAADLQHQLGMSRLGHDQFMGQNNLALQGLGLQQQGNQFDQRMLMQMGGAFDANQQLGFGNAMNLMGYDQAGLNAALGGGIGMQGNNVQRQIGMGNIQNQRDIWNANAMNDFYRQNLGMFGDLGAAFGSGTSFAPGFYGGPDPWASAFSGGLGAGLQTYGSLNGNP